MKTVICHISKKNIQDNLKIFHIKDIEENLFNTFFKNLFNINISCKYIFICPLDEYIFFEDYINNFLTNNFKSSKNVLTRIVGISDKTLNEHHFGDKIYKPSKMHYYDIFGAWDFDFLCKLSLEEGLKDCLIFNVESFWFLESRAYDIMLEEIEKSNFYFRGFFDDDIILGINTEKSKSIFASNLKKKSDQLKVIKENLNYFSKLNFNDIALTLNEKREKIINNHLLEIRTTSNSIKKNDDINLDFKVLIDFLKPWSFRHSFGIELYLKYNSMLQNKDLSDYKNFSETINLFNPLSIRFILNQKFKNNNELNKIFNRWKHIHNWIFQIDVNTSNIILNIIHEVKLLTKSQIYSEINCFINETYIFKLFEEGTDVLVLKINDNSDKIYKNLNQLNSYIDKILNIKNKFKNKYVMLALKKSTNFPDIEYILYTRWKYILDEVIIYSVNNAEFLHNIKYKECNKLYNEITFDPNFNIKLCPCIKHTFSNDITDIDILEKLIGKRFEECSLCTYKNSFTENMLLNLNIENLYNMFLKEKIIYNIDYADKLIKASKYIEALNYIEAVLKIYPTENSAWEKIKLIENILNEK